jgi:hypothetical protein
MLGANRHLALTDFGLCKSFQSAEIIKERSRPIDVLEEGVEGLEESELEESVSPKAADAPEVENLFSVWRF